MWVVVVVVVLLWGTSVESNETRLNNVWFWILFVAFKNKFAVSRFPSFLASPSSLSLFFLTHKSLTSLFLSLKISRLLNKVFILFYFLWAVVDDVKMTMMMMMLVRWMYYFVPSCFLLLVLLQFFSFIKHETTFVVVCCFSFSYYYYYYSPRISPLVLVVVVVIYLFLFLYLKFFNGKTKWQNCCIQ